MCDKRFSCFIHDLTEESLFNENEMVNEEKVIELTIRFDGWVPGSAKYPFNLEK